MDNMTRLQWTAERILFFRQHRGWTQEEMAREMGVSVHTVWCWEAGKQRPTGLSLRRLDEISSAVE